MHRFVGVLWAGSVSAVICYAEYLGLGAMLGAALVGYGDQSQAMGTLLIVLAACISCLVLCAKRFPVIAGPRGASLSVLVLGLISIQSMQPTSGSEQLLILLTMMLGCTIMLFMATLPWVGWIFDHIPEWLVPAFVYASALSIIASATNTYLYPCLVVGEWQTWAIFLSATLAGLLWLQLWKIIAQRSHHPKLSGIARSLAGTSLVVGSGTAWLLYEVSSLKHASAGMCARLGLLDLNFWSFSERFSKLLANNWLDIPLQSLLISTAWGLLVGLVVVIESRTAIAALKQQLQLQLQQRSSHESEEIHLPLMRWNARVQALLMSTTTIASSVSPSRSQVIWNLYQPSAPAVFVHAISLMLIAFFASHWLAYLPHIALAVLMSLVACSMLVASLEQSWQRAYSLSHPGIAGGLGLWGVLAITAITGQALLGFLIPALWVVGKKLASKTLAKSKEQDTNKP